VLITENAKMRELHLGARKDAMIPTGSNVEAEEVESVVSPAEEVEQPVSQLSVEMVNTPSEVLETVGC
jgi:hypothetical protein